MADFLTIILDDSRIVAKVSGIIPRLGVNIRLATNRAVLELLNYIRTQKLSGQVLHVRSGNLRGSVFPTFATSDTFPIEGSVAVGREAPYGRMLEEGTKPHEIRAKHTIEPKGGQYGPFLGYLKFNVGGSVVFTKVVHHPGTKPMPFMRPSLAEKRGSIVAQLRAAVDATLRSE